MAQGRSGKDVLPGRLSIEELVKAWEILVESKKDVLSIVHSSDHFLRMTLDLYKRAGGAE